MSGLNGWQRLFLVVAAVICVPSAGMWALSYPSINDPRYPIGCASIGVYSVTPKEAEHALASPAKKYGWPARCTDSLRSIATGEAHKNAVYAWVGQLKYGAIGIGSLLLALYALGYGIGWIWRGFFPKKTA